MDDRVRRLLFVDFDGDPVDDPDDVIYDAFDDSRYQDRVPGLRALLADESVRPEDRLLACCALTVWGEPDGFAAVIAAAEQGKQAPWYGTSIDRRYSVDYTFSQLAGAVGESADFAAEKGTEEKRVEALRGLLRIAHVEFFDWQLAAALDEGATRALVGEVFAAIERGLSRLREGAHLEFPLSLQLADLASTASGADDQRAAAAGRDLLALDSSAPALKRLVPLIRRASREVGDSFATSLLAVGGDEVRNDVQDALATRG